MDRAHVCKRLFPSGGTEKRISKQVEAAPASDACRKQDQLSRASAASVYTPLAHYMPQIKIESTGAHQYASVVESHS